MQGIKRKRRCEDQCEQHVFGLKNLKNNPKYDIKLSFCPKYQRQPLPPQHTFAEYNNDGLYFTSAFVLGIDKKTIAKNLQKEMLDHQKLIKQNCEKYNQIVFPRPNSKHTTCSVCKETYKNYYQHIFSDEHSQKIQLSQYNVFLKQLCQLFIDQWKGCAEKADHDALNHDEKEKNTNDKKGSDDLNLDDILEEEDIESNPSRISKYIEEESEPEEEVKEVVMKRPTRGYDMTQYQKPQKVYEDRESRKKSINFAAFFDDEPKKKVINDHREAVNAGSKKGVKPPAVPETKPKQKIVQKKERNLQQEDPFIIEYNARNKRKQKKSYYYLKKKQREEKEQKEKEINKKQQLEKGANKSKYKQESEQQQIQSQNQPEIQNEIQQSSEAEYEKYLDQYHQNMDKGPQKPTEVKKAVSSDLKLFEQVEKKPYIAPIFQTFTNPVKINEKVLPQKFLPSTKESRYLVPEPNPVGLEMHSMKKQYEKEVTFLSKDKKLMGDNEQKLQILDKNRIHYSSQNELPLFHKFKNPHQKEAPKENEIRTQKASHEVFNEYEQKIRLYQKQKDYNEKFKQPQKSTHFDDKMVNETSNDNEETVARMNKTYVGKSYEETYRYGSEKSMAEQVNNGNEVKLESYNNASKYTRFSENYYKKPMSDKQMPNHMPLGPMIPQSPYSNPHSFYPSYNYPISPYGYPMHEPTKTDRPKYGEQRQTEPYERGYYYGGWQTPYYLPSHPSAMVPPQNPDLENSHKNLGMQGLNSNKIDPKSTIYPGYPSGYPGYPPVGYPGYYPPPAMPYPASQRPDYPPHSNPSMRIPNEPTPPNTSISINFPMYVGSPYHNPYQYEPQRYPGQQTPGHVQSQYLPSSQNPSKQASSQLPYGSYGARDQASLPPYAEYQEYKKREVDRRK